MRQIGLDELKRLQLQILDEVVEFCNRHQIKYFLLGGTLLGAVRHQGYIPWDDDIDIGMLREDYDRFIQLFTETANEQYYLYGNEVNKKAPFPFIKCCLKETLMTEGVRAEFGINIDIFPIDSISSYDYKSIMKKIYLIKYLIGLKNSEMVVDYKNIRLRSLVKLIVVNLLSCIPNSLLLNIVYKILEKERKNFPNKKGNLVWGYKEKELVSPNIFDEIIFLDFEGKQYSVPKRYDEWLQALFGNYMELPPIEQRVSHHNFQAYIIE